MTTKTPSIADSLGEAREQHIQAKAHLAELERAAKAAEARPDAVVAMGEADEAVQRQRGIVAGIERQITRLENALRFERFRDEEASLPSLLAKNDKAIETADAAEARFKAATEEYEQAEAALRIAKGERETTWWRYADTQERVTRFRSENAAVLESAEAAA